MPKLIFNNYLKMYLESSHLGKRLACSRSIMGAIAIAIVKVKVDDISQQPRIPIFRTASGETTLFTT